MGGALILTAIAVSTVLWADLENHVRLDRVLFVTLSFGVIGYVDDYKKLVLQDPAGISAAAKALLAVCSGNHRCHCFVRYGD